MQARDYNQKDTNADITDADVKEKIQEMAKQVKRISFLVYQNLNFQYKEEQAPIKSMIEKIEYLNQKLQKTSADVNQLMNAFKEDPLQ